MSLPGIKLDRARRSLEGLSIADSLGGFFEFGRVGNNHFIKNRKIPEVQWHYTDDTNMALSIYSILRQFGEIRQDALARSFAQHYERSRGYGRGARHLLSKVQIGGNWRELTRSIYANNGSYGNGGSMRVAPLGAYFADDMDALIENARRSAEITHSHQQGIEGAVAVAVAAGIAVSYQGKDKPAISEFINQVIPHIPDGEVKDNCIKAQEIQPDTPIQAVVDQLGNGSHVSAMDTVPLTLWCAANWLDDYEEAFWQCASAGGDVDTTCAIVGGIIASRSTDSIPASWIQHREPLPDWAFDEVTK